MHYSPLIQAYSFLFEYIIQLNSQISLQYNTEFTIEDLHFGEKVYLKVPHTRMSQCWLFWQMSYEPFALVNTCVNKKASEKGSFFPVKRVKQGMHLGSRFCQNLLKGCRMGRSDKISLWYVALLINTRFPFFILE